MARYVTVAMGFSLDREFEYSVPKEYRNLVKPGMRVLVPFGARMTTGYVTAAANHTAYAGKLKPLSELLDDKPTFTLHLIEFLRWASDYYLVPLGQTMRKALPPSMHSAEKVRIKLTPLGKTAGGDSPLLAVLRESSSGQTTLRKATAIVSRTEVDRLEELGLVERTNKVEAQGPKAAYEKLARMVAYDEEKLTGPRQKEIAALIWQRNVVPVRELKEKFSSADRVLKILEQRGIITIDSVRSFRAPDASFKPPPRPERLTPDQNAAISALRAAVASRRFQSFLLYGVTGSGKTEVYMAAVEEALAQGLSAMILVPEIALTPQLMAAFQDRFPDKVAILHSGLAPGQRYDQWCQVAQGKLPIVLGARSAIFAPADRLGLLVVDEEHEPSFKQDERPFYNARDMALVRAKMTGATVILGSATPSLESYQNTDRGRFKLLELPDRATPRPLPDVVVVDLARSGFSDSARTFSKPLARALVDNLKQGNQTILFLNRKGFAAFLLCQACGAVPRCPHCDISLTYYRGSNSLRCHYCHYGRSTPADCPVCSVPGSLQQVGFGTERVVDALSEILPQARVARLDSSVTSNRKMNSVLDDFRNGVADILVGTQMVAKGHDFPGVTLVGVLLADLSLSFPDFRASERTFQLLTQVAGRAGRGDRPGTVYVQTYLPLHYALTHAQRHDFSSFAKEELEHRVARRFPPFACLALVRISGEKLEQVQATAATIKRLVERASGRCAFALDIMGPGLAPLSYIRNRYRMQMLLRAGNRAAMQEFLHKANPSLLAEIGHRGAVRWDIDVDPVNLM